MADYGYFDYAADTENQQLDWASGSAPIPFASETNGSMVPPSLTAVARMTTATTSKERHTLAYQYAFCRDFAHRYRKGSSFLLKAGFTGTALPAAIRVKMEGELV